ncbi:lipopolysaccharide biosynthesis protein [Robertkochia flava]|uniref:lipopolysaccharide biosynthesis protein n=1 Tax=Robertkochia flava TaxID=3447986 RepID=UPI001CCE7F94|nr:oligosaccharide flippase family protein [Robertkochia marina]
MISRLVNILGKYRSSSYLKDILGQAGWMSLGQLIPVIFSPILTRMYDEYALAEVTGMMTLGSLVLVFSCLNLNSPIIIEKDDENSKQLLITGLSTSFVISIILLLSIYLFPQFFITNFKIDNVAYYVPLYVLSFSFVNLLFSWQIRVKRFTRKAHAKIIESVSYILLALLAFALANSNIWGLALGKIGGLVIALIYMFLCSRNILIKPDWKKAINLIKKYRDFPLFNMPSTFINVLSLQILIIFLGIYYSKSELGFFSLANMVVLAPVALISQSISDIFFQKVVENFNQKNFQKTRLVFYNTLLLLTIIGVPIFLILLFGSKRLFPLIFGSNWQTTGVLASMLSFIFLFKVIISPLGVILLAINRVKTNSLWHMGRFIFLMAILFYAADIKKVEFFTFILYYIVGTAISYISYLIIIILEIERLPKYYPKS